MAQNTPSKKRFKDHFSEITIDKNSLGFPLAKKYPNAKVVEKAPVEGFYREGKKRLHIGGKYGQSLHLCSSMSDQYVCCSSFVLRAMSNCPFECTYCFLQNYLTNGTTSVVADINGLMGDVQAALNKEPWRFFRMGTWELGDSLALEESLGNSAQLVKAFAAVKNAVLDFRTKSDCVEPLLNLNHNGRTVVSWSVNPQCVIAAEEFRTANLAQRLTAMKKVYKAGYKVAIHFDPMVYCDNFEQEYDDLCEQIFEVIPASAIPWISLGVVRFNPEMKKKVEENYPASKITSAEMVLGHDGKVRYVKPLRLKMLSSLYASILKHGKFEPPDTQGEGNRPFVYLCMERSDIWKKVLGYAPESARHLDFLIASSVYKRYPGLVSEKPDRTKYENTEGPGR